MSQTIHEPPVTDFEYEVLEPCAGRATYGFRFDNGYSVTTLTTPDPSLRISEVTGEEPDTETLESLTALYAKLGAVIGTWESALWREPVTFEETFIAAMSGSPFLPVDDSGLTTYESVKAGMSNADLNEFLTAVSLLPAVEVPA